MAGRLTQRHCAEARNGVDAMLEYDDGADGRAAVPVIKRNRRMDQEAVDGAIAVAPSTALAVANARPPEPSQQPTIDEGCNRQVCERHDSVTQVLFSMTLIAQALPRILERDPERALERVARLHELGRGALAEMGALTVHLRPAVGALVPT
jgi:hypothetical protein